MKRTFRIRSRSCFVLMSIFSHSSLRRRWFYKYFLRLWKALNFTILQCECVVSNVLDKIPTALDMPRALPPQSTIWIEDGKNTQTAAIFSSDTLLLLLLLLSCVPFRLHCVDVAIITSHITSKAIYLLTNFFLYFLLVFIGTHTER